MSNHRLIFSISSGRSGSSYLAKLLGTASNAKAYHEAHPDMAGRRVARYPANDPSAVDRIAYAAVYLLKLVKSSAIRKSLRTLPDGHVYIETNHMFISSFYDVVMRQFDDVEVIHLHRYLPKVLKSFIDLDLFGNSPHTAMWTTPPDSPSAAIAIPKPVAEMDQVEKCIAFLVDIEARAMRFRRQYPATKVVGARLERLNRWTEVEQLFGALRLVPTDETRAAVGQVENEKTQRKQEARNRAATGGTAVTIDYCRERIETYLAHCGAAGIELPPMPNMEQVD